MNREDNKKTKTTHTCLTARFDVVYAHVTYYEDAFSHAFGLVRHRF